MNRVQLVGNNHMIRGMQSMHISPIQLKNKSHFIYNYRLENETAMNYFDYSPFNDDQRRLNDIRNRTFKRKQLVSLLKKMNKDWGAPEKTIKQIERLKHSDSVVVIGGQQAGLLTGPLYTINKIISIIQLARQKEAQLNIPVVPIFWIAGEDHDYDEINHVYVNENEKMKKLMTKQQVIVKKSISNLEIDKEQTENWLKQVFLSLQETGYTKQLYETLHSILQTSHTFVDFFAQTIFYLFDNEGIVLFDSQDQTARQIESEFFVQLIEEQSSFSHSVVKQAEKLNQEGYPVVIDVELNDAHLFFHDEQNERILLKRDGNYWIGKNEEVKLTTEQLLNYAKNEPFRLSNNVVSRPLMQEFIFPTLAFVAGDGEISYWATLKKAFHLFNFKMPPVVPRLSFTYVNGKVQSLLSEKDIPIENAINDGVNVRKMNWLQSQQSPPVSIIVSQLKEEIEKIHLPLRNVAKSISDDMYQLAKRNLEIIYREIDFVQNKMDHELMNHYSLELDKFSQLENMLHPNGVLQERVWNPIPFLNNYGKHFIKQLCVISCQFDNEHYVVYL